MTAPAGEAAPGHDVLVVGPNAAVDTYCELEALHLGQVNRISSVRDTAGGKANNLARALLRLGGRPLVVGIAGGPRGAFILDELDREQVDHDYVRVAANSRLNTIVLAAGARQTTVLLEPGQPVAPDALTALADKAARWAPAVGCLALTGSLPPGASPDLYAQIARQAAGAGAYVAVDAAGEALRLAAQAGARLVKVNLEEFESAFPGQARDWGRLKLQASALAGHGLQTLCVTAGARGALVIGEHDQFWVQTEVPEVVSPIGAGDTFLAGLLLGLRRGASLREAARLASAAAAANLLVLGCGFIDRDAVERFRDRTVFREPEGFVEMVN